jgi:hypothetical protein
VVLVALFQSPFYGLLAAQLHLVFIAIALAGREAADPDPLPEPEPERRSVVGAVGRGGGYSPDREEDDARARGPWGPWPEDPMRVAGWRSP